MINVVFNYNDKKISIQSNLEEKMRVICQKFATKAEINVDSQIYFWNDRILSINPELGLTLGKQINTSDKNDIQILVFDDPDKKYILTLNYNGEVKKISSKGNESLNDIINKVFNFGKNKIYGLYNGFIVNDMNKSLHQLANKESKNDGKINIILERESNGPENEDKENGAEKVEPFTNNSQLKENVDENVKNENSEKIIIRNSKEAGSFLIKVYIILLLQFLCIELFTCLGFLCNLNEIVTDNPTTMLWTFILLSLFICIISSMVFFYEEGKGIKFLIFNIVIFVPCIILSCFLLSKYVSFKYIITILLLIISDFLANIIFFIIFRRYIGYGFLLFSLILNSICIFISYYSLQSIETIKEITTISLIGFVIFVYSLMFNNVSKKKFENNELIATVYFFDYSIFAPTFCFFLVALFLALLGIVIVLLLGFLAIILVVFVILTFFDSLK